MIMNLYLKRERTNPGSLGRFSRLIDISSAVSLPILTKLDTDVVPGPVQHLAKSEFRNPKRLPWKLGKGDTPRQPRTFRGRNQAASDIEDTPRQPRTLRTHPGSLGHRGHTQAASDAEEDIKLLFFHIKSNGNQYLREGSVK